MTLSELKEIIEDAIEEYGDTEVVMNDGGMGYVHEIIAIECTGIRTFYGRNVPHCAQILIGSQLGMADEDIDTDEDEDEES